MHEMKQKGRTGFGRCRRCLPQRDVFSALLEFQAKQKVSREVDQRGHLKVVVLLPGCLKEVVEVSQLPAWDLSDDVGRRRGTCQTCAEWLVPHLTALQLSRVQKTMGLYGWKDVSGSVGHSVFWITCLYTGSNSSYGSPDLQDCDFFLFSYFFINTGFNCLSIDGTTFSASAVFCHRLSCMLKVENSFLSMCSFTGL